MSKGLDKPSSCVSSDSRVWIAEAVKLLARPLPADRSRLPPLARPIRARHSLLFFQRLFDVGSRPSPARSASCSRLSSSEASSSPRVRPCCIERFKLVR